MTSDRRRNKSNQAEHPDRSTAIGGAGTSYNRDPDIYFARLNPRCGHALGVKDTNQLTSNQMTHSSMIICPGDEGYDNS